MIEVIHELAGRRHSHLWLGWAAALMLLASPVHGDGFSEHYVAYYGDANGDRRTDIYLKWEPETDVVHCDDSITPDTSSPPDVPNTLLTQTASGRFVVATGAVSQARFAHWPALPDPAVVAVVDFNMDGYMDIGLRFLNSLSTLFPARLADQIVYAPEVKGAAPSVVKVIDAAALKFFTELYGWITNAQYFEQNAPLITSVTGSLSVDYSGFDRRAMEAASLLKNVVLGKETITPGSDLERALEILIGDVLGVVVYGGVFDEGTPEYLDNEGFGIDEYRALIGLTVQLAVVRGK